MARAEKRPCGRCKRELPTAAFARYGRGYQSYCRDCQKEYDAAWYQANKARRRAKARADQQRYVAWLDSLKEGRPCADCGQVYPPYVMEWDHLPGVEKTLVLGNTRGSAHGKERILAEIAKCELVCANCHRERTFGKRKKRAA
jgi:hypothetical protein